MVAQLIEALKQEKVQYVVAPYEADSQLVYLEQNGFTSGIVSEDSDLLVFGAQLLITKLNDMGDCIAVSRKNFAQCSELPLADLTQAQLRAMAILAGCDYSDGIPKIGLKIAHRMIRKYNTGERTLRGIRLEGFAVPADFEEVYEQAELTFLHQRVFCLKKRKLVMLNEPDMALSEKTLEYIGRDIDPKVAQGVALGLLDPFTKKPFSLTSQMPLPLPAPSSVSMTEPNSSNKKITSFFSKAAHSSSSPTLAKPSFSRSEMTSNVTPVRHAAIRPLPLSSMSVDHIRSDNRSLISKRADNLFDSSPLSRDDGPNSTPDFTSKFFAAVQSGPSDQGFNSHFDSDSDSDIEEVNVGQNKENLLTKPAPTKPSLSRFAYKKSTAASVLGSFMNPAAPEPVATPVKNTKTSAFANPFVGFDSSDGSDVSEVETPEKVRTQKRAHSSQESAQPTIVLGDYSKSPTRSAVKRQKISQVNETPTRGFQGSGSGSKLSSKSSLLAPGSGITANGREDMKVRLSLDRFKYSGSMAR